MTVTLTTGVGPFLAGHFFDIAGDYHLLPLLTIPRAVVASFILLWVSAIPRRNMRRSARPGWRGQKEPDR